MDGRWINHDLLLMYVNLVILLSTVYARILDHFCVCLQKQAVEVTVAWRERSISAGPAQHIVDPDFFDNSNCIFWMRKVVFWRLIYPWIGISGSWNLVGTLEFSSSITSTTGVWEISPVQITLIGSESLKLSHSHALSCNSLVPFSSPRAVSTNNYSSHTYFYSCGACQCLLDITNLDTTHPLRKGSHFPQDT